MVVLFDQSCGSMGFQATRRRGEGAGVGGAVYILAGEEGRRALSGDRP